MIEINTKKKDIVLDFYSGLWKNKMPEQSAHDFLERTGLNAAYFNGKKVLDAGCGYGKNTLILSKLNARVIAVDLCDLSAVKKYTEK